MPLWVVIADTHIHRFRQYSKNSGLDRLEVGLNALRKSLSVAKDLNAAWVHLGDFKHVRGVWDHEQINGIVEAFYAFGDVEKHILVGNGYHDGSSVVDTSGNGLSWLRPFASVYREKTLAEIDKVPVFVSPWAPEHRPEQFIEPHGRSDIPRILLGHGFVSGAVVNGIRVPGKISFEDICLAPRDKAKFDVAFFGDVHKRQYMTLDSMMNGPPLLYPGSPYAQNWSEQERDKGFFVVGINISSPIGEDFLRISGSGWSVHVTYVTCDYPVFVVVDSVNMLLQLRDDAQVVRNGCYLRCSVDSSEIDKVKEIIASYPFVLGYDIVPKSDNRFVSTKIQSSNFRLDEEHLLRLYASQKSPPCLLDELLSIAKEF